jgi:hypothetical protein
MTLLLDKDNKALMSIQIASYLDDPTDAVNLTVNFASLPNGSTNVSIATIEGTRKQLSN